MSGQNRRLHFRGRSTRPAILTIKQRLINLHRPYYASNPKALSKDADLLLGYFVVVLKSAVLNHWPIEELPKEVIPHVDSIVAGL